MTLDDEIRLGLERNIDEVLKNPDYYLERIRGNLISQELEPKLDVIISHYSGFLYGRVFIYIRRNYERTITDEELVEFNELMTRRAGEIREAFIKTAKR